MAQPFRILAVCTANICRSPLVEVLLGAALQAAASSDAGSFEVSSAGTSGLTGSDMHESSRLVLELRGLQVAPFTARKLTREHVASADLVLTASGEHRRAILRRDPEAEPRIFTLKEFAAFAPRVDQAAQGDRTAVVAEVAALAAADWTLDPAELDLADPIGLPLAAYVRCAAEVEQAVEAVVNALVPRAV